MLVMTVKDLARVVSAFSLSMLVMFTVCGRRQLINGAIYM